MFSLKGNRQCAVATVVGGDSDGINVYLRKDNAEDDISLDEKYVRLLDRESKFEMLPDLNDHFCGYICGPAKSGKSTFVAKLARKYQKAFPKKKIYIFSSLTEDRPLDVLKPSRINTEDEELIDNPIKISELREGAHGSLLIFDDYDSISNKHIKKAVHDLMERVIKTGRLKSAEKLTAQESREGDIDVLVTLHQINNYRETREILNECTFITIFPGSGSVGQTRSFLKSYMGMSPKEIRKVEEIGKKTRALTISKHCPQFILSDNLIVLNNALLDVPLS